ncbi:MAG: Chromosome-partitioning protein Spo0J [candidate division WS2 bacterium]|nr:Chromosome-partitioning protein Spo0J [Candidatus Lithacetigena glycinireducens]MBT9174856.1 Chromosome-partitioning protein Spo0J [Candidatus Lithacetigena glycinireducens]
MNKKLGRGISILIPSVEDELSEIPIDDIRPSPWQPRKNIQPETLELLVQSIQSTGLIQPIVVRSIGKSYELIAGERRLKAAREAGYKSIKAIVRDIPDDAVMEISLIENIHREELTPIEIAEALKKVLDIKKITQEEASYKLGISRSQVANLIRMLSLPEEVQSLIQKGVLSFSHAKILASLPEPLCLNLAKKIAEKGMSIRETENYLKMLEIRNNNKTENKHAKSRDIFLENFFKSKLSCKVQVIVKNNGLYIKVPIKSGVKLLELVKEIFSKNAD